MSVYRDRRRRHEHISCEEPAADAIKRRASRSGTFGSPRSPGKAFTSGTAAISSTARRSLQVRENRMARQVPHRRAPSVVVVIIANTEANCVGVVAQG